MARLLFQRAPFQAGDPPLFVHPLAQGRTRIGRTDDCDVVLPDDLVSRSHCVIDVRPEGVEVIDRSSNGTYVNGARVANRTALADGDELRVGPFHVTFEAGLAEPAAPTERAQAERHDEELLEAGEGLAVSEAWLHVVDGPGAGERHRLRGARVGVGGPGSRVVLPDPGLVPNHVYVRLVQGRTLLEAGEGAAYVGANRVRDLLPVYAGEEVRLGDTVVAVQWAARTEAPTSESFGEMVGTDAGMRRAFGMLRRMAAHHAPILLCGESGTGKELAARAVHEASPRAGRPFVAVNCGAITPTLFEAELFGYEKGAFTGAAERRDGAFQRAHGGTLFLDEVGELPEEAQSKLLRALESGEVRRVGGADPSFPDVRVVAATNRELLDMVSAGRFRADLYFRLAVLAVRLPPLRERKADIAVLARAIGARIHPSITIEADAAEILRNHPWPGNARELRNVLTRAYVMGGPVISASSLVFNPLDGRLPDASGSREPVDLAERDLIVEALRRHGNNRSRAARALGMPRSSLLYKLRRWGIEEEA